MSASVALPSPQEAWALPAATPLNETVWQIWVAKGRARERRSNDAGLKAVKWVSIVALVAAAVLWSQLAGYDVAFRFMVAAASTVVMFQAFRTGHYVSAAVFGAMVLLYNPVAPVFGFAGDWQRALVLASVFPFVASLIWRDPRTKDND
jgi:hypothetical protein